jgi:catechol 2,3-dioxygenase-like lactoylglutathione lyase family enzyme
VAEQNNLKKFHLSLNVRDLNRSVEFYQSLLGQPPAKHYPDYAKFEMSDPPLVLALEPGRAEGQDHLNHLGIRLSGPDSLREAAVRAHEQGLAPQYLQGVECCYSRQTKFCFTDPDNNLVELYLLDEELGAPARETAPTKSEKAESGGEIWEHLLGSPFPQRIDAEDSSLEEIRLRGTFNLSLSTEEKQRILGEVQRALRPGGKLMLHLLVSDKEVEKKLPRLPGPAALVEYAPVKSAMVKALEEAGFAGLYCKRLSHSAVFQFDGAEMRELMLTGLKRPSLPDGAMAFHTVVYKGPFPEIRGEGGERFRRGERVSVTGATYEMLRQEAFAEHFVFLNESTPSACARPRGSAEEAVECSTSV